MEKAAEVASNMNIRVLKEPRGFIKIILVILAIFAFATTCSSSGNSSLSIDCQEQKHTANYTVGYPFRLYTTSFSVTNCTGGDMRVTLYGDFSPPSQFFVFTGVMAFLVGLATLVLYVFFDDKYQKFDVISTADLVVAVVFVLLWLIASSAWAQGVSDVKYYSDPTELITDDQQLKKVCDHTPCKTESHSPFAGLNVSLIFGFLNMLVWGGSLWFLWKETRWFKANQTPAAPPPQQEPQSQRI